MRYDKNDPFDAKIRAAMVEVAESAPNAPTAKQLGLEDPLPLYAPAITPKPSLRTRIMRGLAGLGLLAGGAGLAVVAATSGDDRSTPEVAFEAFAEALGNEDAIGLLEAIDPNERDALRPAIDGVLVELNRLGLLEGVELDADPLAAFDIDVADLRVASVRLDEGLAAVRLVDGRINSRTDPATLPLGSAAELYSGSGIENDRQNFAGEFDDFLERFSIDRTGSMTERDNVEFFMVERDGEWYLNVGYTLLDAMVKDAGWESPDFGNGLEPVGAESPEALLEAWLAVRPFDWQSRIVLLDPDKIPGLYDFGPVLRMPDEEFSVDDYAVIVNRLATAVDENRVRATEFEIEFTYSGDATLGESSGSSAVTFDGTCVEARSSEDGQEPEVERTCIGDEGVSDAEASYIETLAVGLTVVERDGRWFVDPIATLSDDVVGSAQRFEDLDREVDRDMFAGMVFSNSIFGDIVGFRSLGGLRFQASSLNNSFVEASSGEFDAPPGFACINTVYEEIYGTDGAPNLDPAPSLRADYEACLSALAPSATAEFPMQSFDNVMADAACSEVFRLLWGDQGVAEPSEAEMEAADAEYQQCMTDAGFPVDGPFPADEPAPAPQPTPTTSGE